MTDQPTTAAPTAAELRSELHELLRQDLLGPKHGRDEEIVEGSARDRYLVGMLAPRETEVGQQQDTDEGGAGDHRGARSTRGHRGAHEDVLHWRGLQRASRWQGAVVIG